MSAVLTIASGAERRQELSSGQESPTKADWVKRAATLLSHEIAFVMNDSFRKLRDNEAALEGQALAAAFSELMGPDSSFKKVPVANVHYQRMCATPLLSPELERACFRRFNWLKFRANVYRSQLDLAKVDPRQVLAIELHLAQATEIRNYIVQANCRLAISIVKKYSDSTNVFDDLMSEVISTLIGAVEKFDYSRGFRFSTYATQSIHRRLFRILGQRQKQRIRFVNNNEEALTTSQNISEPEHPKHGQEQLNQLNSLLTHLDLRERLIIEARFGLQPSGNKQTFLEIGKRLKISKERVRQLTERALLKLRSLAEEQHFELA